MLKRFVNYWFRPCTAEYESNWSTACYNRLWYLLAVIDTLALLIVAPIFLATKSCHLPTLMVIAGSIYVVNIVQFFLQEFFFPEECKRLQDQLTHRVGP